MRSYSQLEYEDRCQIYVLQEKQTTIREIARILNVAASTVCRELQRNKGKRGYSFQQAHQYSKKRRNNRAYIKMNVEMVETIREKLSLQWSPQQISGWLKRHGYNAVSHERIYQYVWQDKTKGGDLYLNLRHRGKKYNKRGNGKVGRGLIANRIDIDQRPEIVERKCRIGDMELDTIIGAKHQGVIISMVDRKSKLTKLIKAEDKTARNVTQGLMARLKPMKKWLRTLTSDNGKEFANHQYIAKELDADFFFAKPYHSWERGLNEHTNGLVRQYLPKSTNLSEVSNVELQKIENRLNNRPRAVLDYQTPAEVFFACTGEMPSVALRT